MPRSQGVALSAARASVAILPNFQGTCRYSENMQKRQVFYPFLETLPVFLVFFPEDF